MDKTLLEKMEALPDRQSHAPGKPWSTEMDEALLRYWPTKRQRDVAKALGVSTNTARKRYEALTAEN